MYAEKVFLSKKPHLPEKKLTQLNSWRGNKMKLCLKITGITWGLQAVKYNSYVWTCMPRACKPLVEALGLIYHTVPGSYYSFRPAFLTGSQISSRFPSEGLQRWMLSSEHHHSKCIWHQCPQRNCAVWSKNKAIDRDVENILANCCDQETIYSLAGIARKSDRVVEVWNCLYFNRYTLTVCDSGRVVGICDWSFCRSQTYVWPRLLCYDGFIYLHKQLCVLPNLLVCKCPQTMLLLFA